MCCQMIHESAHRPQYGACLSGFVTFLGGCPAPPTVSSAATGEQGLIHHSRNEHQNVRELIARVENAPTDPRLTLEPEAAISCTS